MRCDFSGFKIVADTPIEIKAAEFFAEEIELRTGFNPEIVNKVPADNFVSLRIEDESESEEYSVEHNNNTVVITAHRLRSLIYGFAEFLKKAVYENGRIIFEDELVSEKTYEIK